MSIPRRLIQTGKSPELKPRARAAVANLTLLHPDWDYLFFDDAAVSRFVASEFPQYESIFNGFRHSIQKFDFFRYLAVFRLGGFYFDLDVFLSENIDSLRNYDCVFPFEELTLNRFLRRRYAMDWEIGNYAFGAASGNGFLEAVIENCVRAQRDPTWRAQMVNGIPGAFDRSFMFSTPPDQAFSPGHWRRTWSQRKKSKSFFRLMFIIRNRGTGLEAMEFISWMVHGGAKEVSCGADWLFGEKCSRSAAFAGKAFQRGPTRRLALPSESALPCRRLRCRSDFDELPRVAVNIACTVEEKNGRSLPAYSPDLLAGRSLTLTNERPLISFYLRRFPEVCIIHRRSDSGTLRCSWDLLRFVRLNGSACPHGEIFCGRDLPLLLHHGHELGCHTFGHCHAYETSPKAFERSILENARALESVVPGLKFKTLSYPIGSPRPGTKRRMARHFSTCRGGRPDPWLRHG